MIRDRENKILRFTSLAQQGEAVRIIILQRDLERSITLQREVVRVNYPLPLMPPPSITTVVYRHQSSIHHSSLINYFPPTTILLIAVATDFICHHPSHNQHLSATICHHCLPFVNYLLSPFTIILCYHLSPSCCSHHPFLYLHHPLPPSTLLLPPPPAI